MQTQSSQETELGLLAHCQRWYPIPIHYFCASPLFPWPWILQLDEWGYLPNSAFQDGGKLHFRLQSRALQVLFPLHPLATFFLWHFASTVSFPSSGVHQWHSPNCNNHLSELISHPDDLPVPIPGQQPTTSRRVLQIPFTCGWLPAQASQRLLILNPKRQLGIPRTILTILPNSIHAFNRVSKSAGPVGSAVNMADANLHPHRASVISSCQQGWDTTLPNAWIFSSP